MFLEGAMDSIIIIIIIIITVTTGHTLISFSNQDKTDTACSLHGREGNCLQILVENWRVRDH